MFRHFYVIIRGFYICALASYIYFIIESIKITIQKENFKNIL